jgi:hypothetical protein
MAASGNAILSAIMLAIFCVMLVMTGGFPPEARLMPLIVGLVGASLSILQLWQSLCAARRQDGSPRPELDAAAVGREVRLLGWFAGFLLAIGAFGFLVAAPAMVLGFLVIEQKERAVLSGALAFGCLAVLYLVFEFLLELSLHPGLVVQFLVG